MKMSKETFAKLAEAVNVPQGATERQRWDALWQAVDARRITYHEVFRGLHDDHVDTALRRLAR